LIDQFKHNGPLPQLLILTPFGIFDGLEKYYIEGVIEASGGCYEVASKQQYHMRALHEYAYRYTLRMIPYKRCRARLIQKGYYRNNKSLGVQADFERAFQGFSGSPLKQRVDEIKNANPELFN